MMVRSQTADVHYVLKVKTMMWPPRALSIYRGRRIYGCARIATSPTSTLGCCPPSEESLVSWQQQPRCSLCRSMLGRCARRTSALHSTQQQNDGIQPLIDATRPLLPLRTSRSTATKPKVSQFTLQTHIAANCFFK